MEHSPGHLRTFVVLLFLAIVAAFVPLQQGTARAGSAASVPAGAGQATLNVYQTPSNQSILVTACGFSAGEQVTVAVATNSNAPIVSTNSTTNANSAGCITNFSYFVPPSATFGGPGTYLIVVNGVSSGHTDIALIGIDVAGRFLTVLPSGSVVSISGCGFTPSATVTVFLTTGINGAPITVPNTVQTRTSDTSGCINFSYPVVAGLAQGTYVIEAAEGTNMSYGLLTLGPNPGPGPGTIVLTVAPSTVLFTGEAVTVSGCGFTPLELVKLYLSTTPSTAGIITTYVATVTASTLGCIGGIAAPANFTVPSVGVAGTYYIVAVGQSSNLVGTVAVSVNLSGPTNNTLTVLPNPAFVGQTITASGCGYFTPPSYALEPVQLLVIPTSSVTPVISQQLTPTVTSPGCVSVTFLAPQIGTYTVKLTGINSANTDVGSLSVSTCGFYTNNCTCPVSNPNNCNCNLFNNTCNCSVYFNNCECDLFSNNCTCPILNSTQCCPYPTFNNCVIYPRPNPNPSPSIAATLTAQPANAAPGQTITLTGAYFYAGGTVTITGLGAGGGIAATASSSGTFTAQVTVPLGTPIGSYSIAAQDSYGHSATAIVYVTTSGATLTASAASAGAGQAITVTGTGFGANEQVSLSLGVPSAAPYAITSPNTITVYTTSANGSFTVTYVVPNLSPAPYALIALGQTSRIEAVIPFTVAGATIVTQPVVTQPGTGPSTVTVNPPSNNTASLPSVESGSTTTYFAEGYTGTAGSNGKATFKERLNLFNNRSDDSDVTITYYVADSSGTRSTVVKHMTVTAHSTATRIVNDDVGNDRNVSIVVRAGNGVVAEIVISRVDVDGQVLDNSSSTGTPFTDSSWYLAEGYTGQSLQEYVTLFNPGDNDARATLRYMPSSGQPVTGKSVTVPSHGQVAINVRSDYNALMPQGSKNIGIQVTSDNEIVVDRAMYWGNGAGSGKFGYAFGPGATSGHSTQYFAYLPTSGGSQSFVTVLNPENSSTSLTLTLRNASGSVVKTLSASVGGRQRYTFSLANSVADSGTLTGDLSSSDNPVVAEAAIYFGGGPNVGAHPGIVVQGATGRGISARAEVSGRGGWLYVYNPTGDAVRVQVSATDSNGTTTVFDGTVSSHSSKAIAVPSGSNPRGIQVRASEGVTSVLLNGGAPGQPTAWGGTLS